MRKAYLVLADGSVYEGVGFGAEAPAIGEMVFTTGVVGYLETLTDPCYAGQIVLNTFPLIGNYGIIEEDLQGSCRIRGYVVRQWCETPSNFRSQYDLDAYLKQQGIPGICGLDTRAITRRIRECGVMNAMICSEIPQDLSALRAYSVCGEVEKAGCSEACAYPAEGEAKYHAAVIDYGACNFAVEQLRRRGCKVTVYPADTPAEEILKTNHDGVLLSDGPGDPAENAACIAEISKLAGKLPLMGISLGFQMLALAAGGRTAKMKHGHRGSNQPVKDLKGTRTYITAQNHGYEVLSGGEAIFSNANDNSCEGMDFPALNAFGVQFRPECSGSPQDTSFLYDRFISMMGGKYHAAE